MTQPNSNDSGKPSSPAGSGGASELTTRRLVVASELLARRFLQSGNTAAAFGNRDRGGPSPAVLAAAGVAVAGMGGGKGSAGSSPNTPQPVVVVGWRAGPINVNIAGAMNAAKGLDAANSFEDARRRAGDQRFNWSAMWKQLKDPSNETKGPAPAPKKDEGAGVAKAMATQFGRVLLPLVAMGTILSANNSGMSALGKATQVLASTLAPVLLPVVVLLAAGLLTVADVIWDKLRPRLARWSQWFIETGIPVVEKFADAVERATGFLHALSKDKPETREDAEQQLRDALGDGAADTAKRFGDWLYSKLEPIDRALPDSMASPRERQRREGDRERPAGPPPIVAAQVVGALSTGVGEAVERATTRAAGLPPGAAPTGNRGRAIDNVNTVITSLQRSLLPKMEITTAAGASRARQLAAGADPLDMKALLRGMEGIRETAAGTTAAVRNLNQPTPQAPPNGRP